jgi:broad specificity phosphatase PhoE
MTLRLFLISHAATPAMRRGDFPDDDALDARGIEATLAWRDHLRAVRADAAFRSPAPCAQQTAQSFELPVVPASALADVDYGRWRGQSLSDVATREPGALASWLGDPDAAPHGGESVRALVERVGAWLDDLGDVGETLVAVTHGSVVRAAIVHAVGAPAAAYSRIEVEPLSLTELRRSTRGWTWIAARNTG